MHQTLHLMKSRGFPHIRRKALDTLQVNLGYKCNQACFHCHVNASPDRTEMMSTETIDDVIGFMRASKVTTLDLTGGAPEMNDHFRRLVVAARQTQVRVIDRCNLTILSEPGFEDLAQFLAEQQVEVSASLPCYSQENVDKQRGEGVFDASIAGLNKLNALGYGKPDSGLVLNLVYNPQGAKLPPPQEALEADYHRLLQANFGIVFNHLFTITNMPIQRFGSTLVSKGEFEGYMDLLVANFQQPLGKTRRVESARDKTRRIFITPAIATKPRVDRAFSWLKARRHDGRRHHNYLLQLRLKCLDKAVKPPKPANGNRD